MVMFNSFLSDYQRVLLWWNLSPQVWKKKNAPGWRRSLKRQSSSVQAPNGILPVEKGRIRRRNYRKPAIFQGKKYEDLTHKDGTLEILQKWKFVSPKIGICHMCQKIVKHQAVWNGASPIAWGYHSVWDPLL